jgi:hypothetical protein
MTAGPRVAFVEINAEPYKDETFGFLNFIKSVHVETVGIGFLSSMSEYFYPEYSKKNKKITNEAVEIADGKFSYSKQVEDVTNRVRNSLKSAVKVIVFSERDEELVKEFVDPDTEIFLLK